MNDAYWQNYSPLKRKLQEVAKNQFSILTGLVFKEATSLITLSTIGTIGRVLIGPILELTEDTDNAWHGVVPSVFKKIFECIF